MRTAASDLQADAVEALLDALREAGLRASRAHDVDIVLEGPAGTVLIEVKAASVLDADRVRAQLKAFAREHPKRGRSPDAMCVLVADQLSGEAREVLRASDWGYLDRRGALWLRGPGLIVNDTSLGPLERQRARRDEPIRGRVGLGVALRRLMHPDSKESVREIAAVLGASPSTVHAALAALREAALLDGDGEPLVPDLFNVVAGVWRPERVPVAREPQPGDADLELGLSGDEATAEETAAWVVAGDVGAAAMGARVVVSSGAPPDFYVPSDAVLRRAVRRLGRCSRDERGATLAVAPSRLVSVHHVDASAVAPPSLPWPVAHPVVLALDLAQDLARGREILDEWTPEGFHRVW